MANKDIFYAFAIHPKALFNDKQIYNAFELMETTIKAEKDFKRSFESFDSAIVNKLNETIDTLFFHNHVSLLEEYTQKPFIGYLMVQYANDKPNYKLRSYKFERDAKSYHTVLHLSEPVTDNFPFLFLGIYDVASKYISSHPNLFAGFVQIKEKLVCLIAEEIEFSPNDVGFPIDAVKITKRVIDGTTTICNATLITSNLSTSKSKQNG